MRNQTHHFSMGVVNVSLRSDCRSFVDEYLALYAPYRREHPGEDPIEVEITCRHKYPWRRGPFTIRSESIGGFEVQRRYEVLPHLEWIINGQIIRQLRGYVQLHAATLEFNGHGLLLPGEPGSGKSTLTAGLLRRCWSYLCDEFALLEPGTLEVHPFPRALCMKEPSFAVVDRLGLPLYRKTPYQKTAKGRVAFLNPLDVRAGVLGQPTPIRWIVFPKYVAGARPTLLPITRSQAAYELAKQCFNFVVYRERAIVSLAGLVRAAQCYQLTSGDIDETCDLIEDRLLKRAS